MSIRTLLGRDYVPVGSQYYRAPSPSPADWERDLAAFAGLGFTMVKFWVQWRWNNPREGHYYFDDIDRLMEIAHRNSLRVMLNTIFDVAPVWVYRKYPDASMVTLDGRMIGPQTQPHRQIGGLGLCLNHEPGMEHLFEFLRVTVDRYTRHPALEIWNVGSEPELTSSMAEMRLYADDARNMRDMLCYCDRCREMFRNWLRERYGTIEKLNLSWNRNYHAFEEAEVPLTRNSFNDMVDWRMFFVHTLGENVRRRFDVARSVDMGKHPLMCHHVFIQGFPVTSTASDPWNVGRFGDLHGFTQMDDPAMCDILRSCARGKPVISAEMLMLFGYTLDLPKPIGMYDIKRFVFTGVAANLKGFIFWQYRPEVLAREAPAWGLTHLDGSQTPWLRDFAEVNRVLQRNMETVLDGEPPRAEIAVVYNPENQVFGWAATGNEKNVTDSLLGTHRALYERNFVVDFLHAREITPEIVKRYRVICIPFPYFLSESICRVLESWVKNGGVLIGESYFAGWDVERGQHQTTVPGYGMHRVFQVQQEVAMPPESEGIVRIELLRDLPPVRKGEVAHGAIVKEALRPEGAEVLGRFVSGEAAITRANYGAGKAIMIGSFVGLPFFRSGHSVNGNLITGLVAASADIIRPRVEGPEKVRVDTLSHKGGQTMVIIRNLEPHPVAARIAIPLSGVSKLTEQFTGDILHGENKTGLWNGTVSLQQNEVRVYCG